MFLTTNNYYSNDIMNEINIQQHIDEIEEMQKSFYRSMVSISGVLCTPSQKIGGGVSRAAYDTLYV